MTKVWYAVDVDMNNDWGTGSYDYEEALRLAEVYAEGDTFDTVHIITVEEGNDPIAIEIEQIK